MGNFCVKKTKKTRGDIIEVKVTEKEEIFYKPKISSNSVICYKPKNKTFWEEILPKEIRFQNGCIFSVFSENIIFCIGGVEFGDFAVSISITPRIVTKLAPPPQNISYGFLHKHKETAYIIGSISQTSSGSELAAPCLSYNMKTDK